MKKIIIGSLVGAVLLFGWQTLSWMVLGIHDKAFKYTPAQDSLISVISNNLKEEGQYVMPNVPTNATQKEMEECMQKNDGKPWAVVSYHKTRNMDMTMPIILGFLICLVCIVICCLVIKRLENKSFNGILGTSLCFGIVCFLFASYMGHNWMQTSWDVLTGDLIDDLVGWTLAGTWLGWWYSRK
jgi:hypothetical protein